MAEKQEVELKVFVPKPAGPKPPTMKETIINLIVLAFILAAFGILDDVLMGIDHFISTF